MNKSGEDESDAVPQNMTDEDVVSHVSTKSLELKPMDSGIEKLCFIKLPCTIIMVKLNSNCNTLII